MCFECHRYSIVMPVLNEGDRIARSLESIRRIHPDVEILVVDGGSSDGTLELAAQYDVRLIRSRKGRGIQCNAGFHSSYGEILLFLHADTSLPSDAFCVLESQFSDPTILIGTFRLQFDRPHWILRTYASCTRFDSMFTRFGDQCIVVRRSFLQELGGFADWPLFEDVHLLRLARRKTRVVSFPAAVTTSARRFNRVGILRNQARNILLFARYLLGTQPEELAREYDSVRMLQFPGYKYLEGKERM